MKKLLSALLILCALSTAVFPVLSNFPAEASEGLYYTGYGANHTVSGSLHYLDYGDYNLVLDAGIFYGNDAAGSKAITKDFVERSDALILSHAHLDHSGRIFQMYKLGYRNPIYCSELTKELVPTMLGMVIDYGGDLGEEKMLYSQRAFDKCYDENKRPTLHPCSNCEYAKAISPDNERAMMIEREEVYDAGYRLCTICTALEKEEIMRLVHPIKLNTKTELNKNLQFHFLPTPHLPGAVITVIQDKRADKTLMYSGDVGSGLSSFLGDQGVAEKADIVILEGTYGYSIDTELPDKTEFIEYLADCIPQGKRIIIPAFVLDRSQQVIAAIKQGVESQRLPADTKVSLLSPSANEITEIYLDIFPQYKNVGLSSSYSETIDIRPFYKEITKLKDWDPKTILVTSSGMANMGYSMETVKRFISDPDTVFMFVGYQDPETIGGELNNLANETAITIDGECYDILATVQKFSCFRGHAAFPQMCQLLDQIERIEKLILVHHNDYDSERLTVAYSQHYPDTEVIAPGAGDAVMLYSYPSS